jgi:hypothetical protein
MSRSKPLRMPTILSACCGQPPPTRRRCTVERQGRVVGSLPSPKAVKHRRDAVEESVAGFDVERLYPASLGWAMPKADTDCRCGGGCLLRFRSRPDPNRSRFRSSASAIGIRPRLRTPPTVL